MIRESPDFELAESHSLQNSLRFSWPVVHVQLVKSNDSTLGHSRQKCFQRYLCRAINIKIQVQQRDNQVLVILGELGNCLACVA